MPLDVEEDSYSSGLGYASCLPMWDSLKNEGVKIPSRLGGVLVRPTRFLNDTFSGTWRKYYIIHLSVSKCKSNLCIIALTKFYK
jgi:hypothetical protein